MAAVADEAHCASLPPESCARVGSPSSRASGPRLFMLITRTTAKSLTAAAADLQAAVEAHHFGVMHVHNLKETMAKKGVEFARECLIFEVCQPQQAKTVLDENMQISTALPCRISVYEEAGRIVFATLQPTVLLALFQTPQLDTVACEIEDTLITILNTAAR
jgi:uncharacterized protein (DUF302 family)